MPEKIYVANPMAYDGFGPSNTCLNICSSAAQIGYNTEIFAARSRIKTPQDCSIHSPYSNIGRFLPYRYFNSFLRQASERVILNTIPENSIVYAWPSLSQHVFSILKSRNCKIALEVINFHTLSEKKIIEDEMRNEGISYKHYVTPEKIAAQKMFLSQADVIFISSEQAKQSLINNGCNADKIVLSCYGSNVIPKNTLQKIKKDNNILDFLYVGRISLEKGIHHLLRSWEAAGEPGRLHLYGDLDSNIAKHFSRELALPSIKLHNFSRNIGAAYQSADAFIFLSLAEGGALVPLEAAEYGLPMVTSHNGGGQIAINKKTALIVEASNINQTANAIKLISKDHELRLKLSSNAHKHVRNFTWARAAKERFEAMSLLF